MMRWLSVLALILVSHSSSFSFAEGGHAGAGRSTGGGASASQRATVGEKIADADVATIKKSFPTLTETYIRSRWNEPLPNVVEKALKEKDETDMANVMGALFGFVDQSHIAEIKAEAKKEKDAEEQKDPGKRDDKHLAVLKRLFWAVKILDGEPVKTAEAEEFNKKFAGEKLDFKKGAFIEQQTKNKDLLNKIKNAAQGNDVAKKELVKDLNHEALPTFLQHLAKNGKSPKADEVISNVMLAYANGPRDGQKSVDFVGPNNEPWRLYIGKNGANAVAAFKGLSNKFTLAGVALSPTELPEAKKSWFIDDSGQFKPGAPAGLEQTKVAAVSKENVEAALTKPSGACFQCHQNSPFTVSAGANGAVSITKGGKTYTVAELAAAAKEGQMATVYPGLSLETKAMLESWASAK